jgi:cytochrome c peroxidase
MGYHNLGFKLRENEITALMAFMKTLTGERPKILQESYKAP